MRATSMKMVHGAGAFLAAVLCSPASGVPLSIPNSPLFLTSTGVTPNITLTIDDSGSMRRAYVPEICGDDSSCIAMINRYYKSSHYNALYYNPYVIYTPPKDANGNSLSTAFGAAWRVGFDTAVGSTNLNNAYLPTAGMDLNGGATHTTNEHYSGQRGITGIMRGTNSGSNAPYFDIPNFWNMDGSAAGHDPGTNLISVRVAGNNFADNGTLNADTCSTGNDPAAGYFRTRIIGTTLRLCFNDSGTYYNSQVEVRLKDVNRDTNEPANASSGAPAYYYVFDGNNGGNCIGTAAEKKVNNSCYDYVRVSATSGPSDTDTDDDGMVDLFAPDLNGDGVVDASDKDERQNFANWYSFYRTRNLATASGASLAFNTLDEEDRVAWQALNTCQLIDNDCDGWRSNFTNKKNAIGNFSGSHKSNFYAWLFQVPTNGGTPLREAMIRAGDYYTEEGEGSAYDNDYSSGNSGQHSCRKNFHVLMTDGIWNDSLSNIGNVDNTAIGSMPEPSTDMSYAARTPYKDSYSHTLADVAFKYWSQDLTNLDNNVASNVLDRSGEKIDQFWNAKNDPASWQHMVNYTIGLGLSEFLASAGLTWSGDTYSGSYTNILAGTLAWPQADAQGGSDPDYGTSASDLWHAAINSRGKFYSAESPDEIVTAFQDILDTIDSVADNGGGAGLSSNTSQIDQEGVLIFEAKFNADWSGQLLARPVDADLNLDEALWDAGQRIPPPHARRIFTLNSTAEALQPPCAGGPLQDALDLNASGTHDGLCSKRVNWLRGDGRVEGITWSGDPLSGTVTATFQVTDHGFVVGDRVTVSDIEVNEEPAPAKSFNGALTITETTDDSFSATIASDASGPGSYASGGRVRYTDFRDRPISVLGDIMGSDPVYSYADDFGYAGGASAVDGKDPVAGEGGYANYVASKEEAPPVIYVGANDGMLHAFCADNPDAPPTDPDDPDPACPPGVDPGEELFAYVPRGVYDHLSDLTDPFYAHRYYVDGQINVSDAYLAGTWGTYLVGALGAGGKAIYALDVSDTASFDASDVKWELTDADDLGLTFSKPHIAPVTGSRWGVIFGNGYNSGSDTAKLYVVDLADGSPIAKIPTNGATSNGLSTPYLHDRDGDMIVDVVYAGDLQGNLWKFVNDAGTWALGNGGQALFTARNAATQVQPITTQPAVAPHPEGGVLVYFGTGSYLTHCDIGNPEGCNNTYDDQQTFYAIWDKPEATGNLTRNDLEGHSILQETTAHGFTVRTTSNETVNWMTDRGWYLDLPLTPGSPAERIVSPALVMQFTSAEVPDRVLFVTNTPSEDPCAMGGTTWLMELDLVTGGRPTGPIFDLDGSGSFDQGDEVGEQPPSGVALDSAYGITGEPLILTTEGGNIVKAFSGTTGKSGTDASPLQQGEPPPAPGPGSPPPTRLYWRQIL